MSKNISRRNFIRTAVIGTGVALTYSMTGGTLFAKSSKKRIYFYTKKAKGGCSKCEKEIAAMLKDKTKLKKLESLFPAKTKVYFYVRKQKKRKFPKGINIAVGSCARALKDDADLFIPGCGKAINKDAIFKAIVAKFEKVEETK